MKNKIVILALVFLVGISFISAVTIDAGSCETIPIETSNKIFWTVSGNSSSVEGIEITQDGSNVKICLDVMFQEDNLTISLIEEQTKEVIREVNVGGGGGSSTRWKTEYVENNVTTYLDKEVKVPGETIEVEKIVKSSKWLLILWIALGSIIGFLIYGLLFDNNANTDTRRYEKNE